MQTRQEALGDTSLQGCDKDGHGPPPAHGAGDLLPSAASLLCEAKKGSRVGDVEGMESQGVGRVGADGWGQVGVIRWGRVRGAVRGHYPPASAQAGYSLTRPWEATLVVHTPAQGTRPLWWSSGAAEGQTGLAVPQQAAQAQAAGSWTLWRQEGTGSWEGLWKS